MGLTTSNIATSVVKTPNHKSLCDHISQVANAYQLYASGLSHSSSYRRLTIHEFSNYVPENSGSRPVIGLFMLQQTRK